MITAYEGRDYINRLINWKTCYHISFKASFNYNDRVNLSSIIRVITKPLHSHNLQLKSTTTLPGFESPGKCSYEYSILLNINLLRRRSQPYYQLEKVIFVYGITLQKNYDNCFCVHTYIVFLLHYSKTLCKHCSLLLF